MIGWALRQLFGWLAAGLAIYAVIVRGGLLAPVPRAADATALPAVPAAQQAAATNSLEFRAARSGHVVLDAAVNGAPVRMIVDTGATLVTLTRGDAAAAGLGTLSYTLTLQTANGRARAAPVKLREIRIGQLEIGDVPAVVVENLNISLLGQSFLRRLDSYQMRDGVLILNW
jgi:aspartyl protease family protein